jgi:pimeloyl-ACP methyl ester carboxylesterase
LIANLNDWKNSGSYFLHQGSKIFFRKDGDPGNPTLLLIHGFPTASYDWELIWNELSKHYFLVALDMIGFGFSDKPEEHDYSLLEQTDIHEHLLKDLGITSFHVLAHDYGVSIAQELLARDKENSARPVLESVCFLNGGLFPETHHRLLIQDLLLSPIGKAVAMLMTRGMLEKQFRKIFSPSHPPSQDVIDTSWEMILFNDGRKVFHKLIGYIPERKKRRERWVGAVTDAHKPVKIINGIVDPVSGAHMLKRCRELVASPNITELSDVGHYPQIEDPAAVLSAYLEFRQSLKS